MRRLLLATMIVALALTGCGDTDGGVLEGEDVTLQMFDNSYAYEEVRIPVGGSVTFAGAGRQAHNAVAADGSWSTETVFGSLDQLEGDEATLIFTTPGEFVFFCTYHGSADGGGMAATLIVTP